MKGALKGIYDDPSIEELGPEDIEIFEIDDLKIPVRGLTMKETGGPNLFN